MADVSVTMWTISFWQSVPAPVRLDVFYRTVPERSYYGHHHGHGHTAYVSEERVFGTPLSAAAAWYKVRREHRIDARLDANRVLAELMPDIFGPGWEEGE